MEENKTCCSSPRSMHEVARREFLTLAGVGVVGTLAGAPARIMAGNFTEEDLNAGHLVPADKKLDATWIKSLFDRGDKEVYRGKGLENIGMPCGGIGSGQLYLCGDGTLGSWQIFNHAVSNWIKNTGSTYEHRGIAKPVDQGFSVIVDSENGKRAVRPLSREGFRDISFQGEYPTATIRYADADAPIVVEMEAFSPFIPLNAKDSALPATVFHITLRNTSSQTVRASVMGWLENAVCSTVGASLAGDKVTTVSNRNGRRILLHSAKQTDKPADDPERQPIVFENFETEQFDNWTLEGNAFSKGPFMGTAPNQQPVSGFQGERLVNSFSDGDVPTGKMISRKFKIDRPFINSLVGGGPYAGKTCVNLVVDGKLARSAVGRASEQLGWTSWYVQDLMGHEAHIEIVDDSGVGWGHILVDQIEFSDAPRASVAGALQRSADYGTMALACDNPAAANGLHAEMLPVVTGQFVDQDTQTVPLGGKLVGVCRALEAELAPGEEQSVTFALAWHFPNAEHGNYYATLFADAQAVVDYVFDEHSRLAGDTRLWREVFYDSTLPYWLLDRLQSTVSTLATGTCQWWANGRFYAFEGVTCCEGTCTHVWNYAHTHARLFPEIGRNIREMQDFSPRENGGGFHLDSGLVGFRSDDKYAADGQCGTILKAFREHQMSKDSSFLHRFWPRIKLALLYSIAQDGNSDGLIENTQHNTYDINYEGANTFVGALYLAALRAGEEMAIEIGDTTFAKHCRAIFEAGSRHTQERLWNGEYFTQEVDLAKHPMHQYQQGCLSDHLFGQGWAHQLGLGYLYPQEMVISAIAAVWKYNWAPDVQPYNDVHKPGRWFISPGQAGLLTCTWPKSDYLPNGTVYKNEVWSGIEYQVAGHLIAEGMVTEGLAICRAIHDRYQPELYNPYNEIECGDHYARAMASWGVFLALAGYEYHGPKGHLAFAPKITPEHFKSAFTAAEGWGTFEQTRSNQSQTERIAVRWGKLRLSSLAFELPADSKSQNAQVTVGGRPIKVAMTTEGGKVRLSFQESIILNADDVLKVQFEM